MGDEQITLAEYIQLQQSLDIEMAKIRNFKRELIRALGESTDPASLARWKDQDIIEMVASLNGLTQVA